MKLLYRTIPKRKVEIGRFEKYRLVNIQGRNATCKDVRTGEKPETPICRNRVTLVLPGGGVRQLCRTYSFTNMDEVIASESALPVCRTIHHKKSIRL